MSPLQFAPAILGANDQWQFGSWMKKKQWAGVGYLVAIWLTLSFIVICRGLVHFRLHHWYHDPRYTMIEEVIGFRGDRSNVNPTTRLAPDSQMTPEERLHLQSLGTVLLYNLSGHTAIVLLQGVFIGIFAVFLRHVLRRGLSARPTQILFATSIAAFLLSVMGTSCTIAVNTSDIKAMLLDSAGIIDVDLIDRLNLKLVVPQLLSGWANQTMLVISDCIVVWRASVLYPRQGWVMLFPLLLLAGTFGSSLGFLIVETNPALNVATHKGADGDTINMLLSNLSVFFSLATNAVATFLVMVKFWMHRRFLGGLLVGQKRLSSATRAMLILLESGMFYCALQVISIIGVYLPVSSNDVHVAFNGAATGALFGSSGMYPIIVILLITKKRSEIETFGFSAALKKHGAPDLPEVEIHNIAAADVETPAHDDGIAVEVRT